MALTEQQGKAACERVMKHTPGPWHRNIPPANKYNTVFAGRNTHVAHLHTTDITPEQVEANADLIAAAPDMLDALIDIVENVLIDFPDNDPRKVRVTSIIDKATK